MAGQKRTYEVSEIEADKNVTVHGVVVELSPIKESAKDGKVKYFSGKVSDGRKVARVISFEPTLRPSLEKFRQEGKSVALVNCKVQESKFDQSLEIMTSKYTKVESSPRKFNISDTDSATGPESSAVEVDLDRIAQLAANQRIAVTAKVVKVAMKVK